MLNLNSTQGFSVILPTSNQEKSIRETLRSVWIALQYLQKLNSFPVEVIVVDCNSIDKTVEIARSTGTRILHHTGQNKTSALAAGLSVAKYNDVVMVEVGDVIHPMAFAKLWEGENQSYL